MAEDDFEQALQLRGDLLRSSLQEVQRAIVRLPSPVARISHGVAGLYQIPFVTEREGGGCGGPSEVAAAGRLASQHHNVPLSLTTIAASQTNRR
jgi:hypothetical protein